MKVTVPGDKSLTQRALILASLATGTSTLRGLLSGGDADSTAGALRRLGVEIPPIPPDGREITVRGVGFQGLSAPSEALDLGNSGTGTRLLLGVLAGAGVPATLTGDETLQERPMKRVTDPLSAMGASFDFLSRDDRLPIRITNTFGLNAIEWTSAVASAQVKSAVLLAGLTSGAFVQLTEPRQSRDHTEQMLRQLGVSVISHAVGDGWRVEMRDPPSEISGFDFSVPGDISSAAFVLALGALGATNGSVSVVDIGLNRTRTAFLDVLERMGVELDVTPDGESGFEPTGSVTVSQSHLTATSVRPDEVPRLIDELPLVAVLGARAEGRTEIRHAAELRTKESDRITALARNLERLGVEVEEYEDGLAVVATGRPLSGSVRCYGDHRIAMAFGVLGAQPENRIEIDDPGAAAVSFPGFWELIARLTAERQT